MTLYVELNGHPVKKARLTISTVGNWSADVVLDRVTTDITFAPGSAVLQFVDQAWVGTVHRMGALVGTASFRLSGGFGGWGNELPPEGYNNPAGVKLSSVLGDAARLTGEQINVATDASLGSHYARIAGPASQLLDILIPAWWMRPDGVTTSEARRIDAITSPFDIIPEGSSLFLGRIHVATEQPSDWTPDRVFSAPVLSQRTIGGVEHRLDAGKLRTEVWTQE